MSSWITLMVQRASSDGNSTGIASAGIGGHALIAIKASSTYEVFHLVGARQSSSGSGHAIYNSNSSIERYRWDGPNGRARSVGGLSGTAYDAYGPLPAFTWYTRGMNANLNILESPRLNVESKRAKRLKDKCLELCQPSTSAGVFSLVGADVRLGTNCITWAYDVLRSEGITFGWKMYTMSFISPRKAVEMGGELKIA